MNLNYKRFFCQVPLGDDLELDGGEHHHLAHVLRCRVGDIIILVNGDAFDYCYRIENIKRNSTELKFIEMRPNTANPRVALTVYMGLIKRVNIELVVEKLNEIGVTNFVPFICERSNFSPDAVRICKLQEIANQSCKQCGRSTPLRVLPVRRFDQMIGELGNFDTAFYADRGEKRDKIRRNKLDSGQNTIALVIGPEGGLTIEENLELATRATPVTLGARTLRSETASIVAATLVLNRAGEI